MSGECSGATADVIGFLVFTTLVVLGIAAWAWWSWK